MKKARVHSRDLTHHDRRVKLEQNQQASITSTSSDGSSPISLVELKSGGKKAGRQGSFHRTALGTPKSARRMFRTIFDKNSKKSVSESAASRRDCCPSSGVSSTTDPVGSISTSDSSSPLDSPAKELHRREKTLSQQPCGPKRMSSSKSQTPRLLDSQGEDAALADSINFLLSGSSPKFTNISDDAALEDSINFLLGGSPTKFPAVNGISNETGPTDKSKTLLDVQSSDHRVSNELKTNSSLDLEFKPFPLTVEHSIFVDHLPPSKISQGKAADGHKSLQPDICMVEKRTKAETEVDISVLAAARIPPPPPPVGQNDFEPATPCFSPKSPIRTKKVTPTQPKAPPTAEKTADPKIDDFRNMTQDALREMVQQKSPLHALPEKRSIPAFICIRNAAGTTANSPMSAQSRASEQFQKAQELLFRLENDEFGEGLSALQKQVEALETEVLLSTVHWPAETMDQCDSEVSSLGEDSYNGEDSYLNNDESPWWDIRA